MRDNLIFSGKPEQSPDNPKRALEEFTETSLKLSKQTVEEITFHRVHCLTPKVNKANNPAPIIAKFEHHKHKEFIKAEANS